MKVLRRLARSFQIFGTECALVSTCSNDKSTAIDEWIVSTFFLLVVRNTQKRYSLGCEREVLLVFFSSSFFSVLCF